MKNVLISITTAAVIFSLINLLVKKNETKPVLTPVPTQTPTPTPVPKSRGLASNYVAVFDGLNCDDPKCIMANGQPFDEQASTMACAARFPLGTKIRLYYKGKTEVAECTDRGGFEALGRTFDLSKGLFQRLAPGQSGVIRVDYELVDSDD